MLRVHDVGQRTLPRRAARRNVPDKRVGRVARMSTKRLPLLFDALHSGELIPTTGCLK